MNEFCIHSQGIGMFCWGITLERLGGRQIVCSKRWKRFQISKIGSKTTSWVSLRSHCSRLFSEPEKLWFSPKLFREPCFWQSNSIRYIPTYSYWLAWLSTAEMKLSNFSKIGFRKEGRREKSNFPFRFPKSSYSDFETGRAGFYAQRWAPLVSSNFRNILTPTLISVLEQILKHDY